MNSIARALISVSDKTGIVKFAQSLIAHGVIILSTGGTAKLLEEAGISVTEVSDYTGFPEMLDGRLKTLHPKIHGGILGLRDNPKHRQAMQEQHIENIDLVCVNLYPFAKTIARKDSSLSDAIENIDIGGPTMLRAAAKNWQHVAVVTDVADYTKISEELSVSGELSNKTKFALAQKAFAHTATYDQTIANYLGGQLAENQQFPELLNLALVKVQNLRYGENPHQAAAFYRDATAMAGGIASSKQLQGKELSFNNIADANAAWESVKDFSSPTCVIVKHANPCGVASADNPLNAYRLAYATDKTSAFGGIIAFNCSVDAQAANQIILQFVEVLIAPQFSAEALTILATKKNLRVLEIPLSAQANALDFKRVTGGMLVQTPDTHCIFENNTKCVSQRTPTKSELQDLMFAWNVAKHVKSNAIVFCKNQQTLGIGAGQMSRVDSTQIAARKAQNAGLNLYNSVAASDAFFPFRDGVDIIAAQGISAIIHPGGSLRDDEVIAAANEHNIALLVTGVRHFYH